MRQPLVLLIWNDVDKKYAQTPVLGTKALKIIVYLIRFPKNLKRSLQFCIMYALLYDNKI